MEKVSFCVVCVRGWDVESQPYWEIPEEERISRIVEATASAAEKFGTDFVVKVIEIAC